jgi:DNA-binding PadR family transcriptional regulator
MAKGDFLGEFEYVVLLSIIRLGSDAYGMTIRQDIENRTERSVSVGAVYAALERLEAKGYLHSREGETTQGRGGRSKIFYEVTAAGKKAVQQTRTMFRQMEAGTEQSLGSGRIKFVGVNQCGDWQKQQCFFHWLRCLFHSCLAGLPATKKIVGNPFLKLRVVNL